MAPWGNPNRGDPPGLEPVLRACHDSVWEESPHVATP
jgi:hypothetical protein